MNRKQFISCILFHIFFSFLSINLVKSLELKKEFVKGKELKFKLRSLDEGSTEDDEESPEEMSVDEQSVDESSENNSEENNGNSTRYSDESDDHSSEEDNTSKESPNSSEDDSLSKEETSEEQENSEESISESTIPTYYNSTMPATSSYNNSQNSSTIVPFIKKSSSGLSTGAICAIVIPCIAALLGVAIAAALLKGTPTLTAIGGKLASPSVPAYIDSSIAKFKAVESVPMQQQIPQTQIVQPQVVQPPQPVQVQPVQQVVRPNYPVNRIKQPPRIVQQPQQVQMVPVQEVQMVPVQEVQMVPVEQVEMVPIQEMQMVPVQQVEAVPVQQVEAVPVQQVSQVQQIQTVSEVPQMGQEFNFEMVQP